MSSADHASLERYRAYLHFLAWRNRERLAGLKLDPSDLVQETLLKAHQHRNEFEGKTEAEYAAWLRRILLRVMLDGRRRQTGPVHDVGLERSLDERLSDSAAKLEDWLAANSSSPSDKADRQDQLLKAMRILERLPDRQREAWELHKLDGLKLEEIARRMKTTREAVGGLLRRAVATIDKLVGQDLKSDDDRPAAR